MFTDRIEERSIKIAVLELYCNGKENAVIPVEFENIYPISRHAEASVEAIRQHLPNAEIYLLPANAEGINWIINHNINNDKKIAIVNLSASSTEDTFLEKQLSDHAFLVTSGGNAGDDGESFSARQEYWCSVGAVKLNKTIPSYSSYKYGAIDTCMFTDYNIGDLHIGQTSGASPTFVGLLSHWYIWYEDLFGVYPSTNATYDFIEKNSHNIWDNENPLKYGYGLFKLPHKFKASEIIIDVDSGLKYAKKYVYIEDEPKIINQVDLLEVPRIINGRTFVPSNGLTSALGVTVKWENDTRTSHYIK